jgi:hypothetical protein
MRWPQVTYFVFASLQVLIAFVRLAHSRGDKAKAWGRITGEAALCGLLAAGGFFSVEA